MNDDIDWNCYVDGFAQLHDLDLDELRRAEIVLHLARMSAMARPLLEFDDDRHCDPAPVFHP